MGKKSDFKRVEKERGWVKIWCRQHERMALFCLVSATQASAVFVGIMAWGIFAWHTQPLVTNSFSVISSFCERKNKINQESND